MNPWLMVVCMILFAMPVSAEVMLYVSPTGRDTQAGTEAEPLATLAGARDRVRTLDKDRPITVIFAAGTYRFSEPVEFEAQDSGTTRSHITYRADDHAIVRFTGGVNVTAWKPVTDKPVLERLPVEARPHVRVADLNAQDITELGELKVYGFGIGVNPAEAELFFGDRPLTPARWPNVGFNKVDKVLDPQHLVVDTDRIARWAQEPDPWVLAYWHHDWAEVHEPIVGFDAEKHIIKRSKEIEPKYGITAKSARWFADNMFCELDTPGEYYIDRQNRLVYLWPPEGDGLTVLSQATGFIEGRELSHVTFRGFVMGACRDTAVKSSGGSDLRVVGCTIRNVGTRAVEITGGTDHLVYGCDIGYCGAGGIMVSGGDTPTLTPAGHNIENNHIHHYSRRNRTYRGAVQFDGVGIRIAHNLIHHAPHTAILGNGNNNTIEFNEISDVIRESGDAGALYAGRDWTKRGTVIRYNYWHDITGETGLKGMAIYQDDQISGQTITGNIFENVNRAVFLGGGCDHTVTYNVFVNCWRSVHLDDRGMNWQRKMVTDPDETLQKRLRAVPYKSELWQKQYPTLANILEDDPGAPKRNLIRANISAGGKWDDIKASTKKDQVIDNNLVFDNDPTWITLVKDKAGKLTDIRFKDPAAIEKIAFKTIPVEKIGLYEDPRRASWPIEDTVRK
ncbi:MAG: hypothetical protein GC164_03310 [Phycisphaera sp.]|nr:hypothetical protein [Phycisphaera sp.]